ncbi:MAG: hypothetical protein ABI612_14470 [Betaproteobacteria bacterium]
MTTKFTAIVFAALLAQSAMASAATSIAMPIESVSPTVIVQPTEPDVRDIRAEDPLQHSTRYAYDVSEDELACLMNGNCKPRAS